MAIRLVITDDHPVILNGLESLFQLEEDFELVAMCSNGEETLDAVRSHKPDVVVLDVRIPGKDGLALARQMQDEKPAPKIVLYTAEVSEDQFMEAIRLGVGGIVLKEMEPEHLIQCIRKVYAGEQWIERRTAWLSLEKLLKREADAIELTSLLTAQETRILKLVAKGLSNRQISENLCISEGTIKVHLHNIYKKLNVKNRVSLLRYAQEKELI
ncbi:MAG TPA: response regulator transcription factor [Syntrophales bacterium]|jgi:DNA-binding NarL/FixJ family response regulator|nr:response regulator transcription factor [Syntrophales bacterium]